MKKSSKIYALYGAAMLAVGSVFMYFQSNDNASKPEKGNVSVFVTESTGTVKKTATTSVTKYKLKITTTTASKTTAVKTTTEKITTETTVTDAEILWIDINEADEEELAKLPKIGQGLAAQIAGYRNDVGRFRNIEEIMNISGIGQGTFDAIKDYIYVVDPVYDNEEQETEPEQEETEHMLTLEDIAPIDLNTAAKEELMLIPDVDEETAQSILDLREKIGKFGNPNELLLAEGLSQKKAAEICRYVCVVENGEVITAY